MCVRAGNKHVMLSMLTYVVNTETCLHTYLAKAQLCGHSGAQEEGHMHTKTNKQTKKHVYIHTVLSVSFKDTSSHII